MIPPEIDPATKSAAERKIFAKLQGELSNEWTVLHSLNLRDHPTKPWSEIDFVLVGPIGVFCLEVKGGRVKRVAGEWQFIDRNGNISRDYRGPFRQVQDATQALTAFIKQERPTLRSLPVMSGVVTPDSVVQGQGPDIVPEIVLDLETIDQPFPKYLKRLTDYWRRILETKAGVEYRRLTSAERDEIVRLLRPDFDFRVGLRPRIGEVKTEIVKLTDDQLRVLDGLEANKRVVITGGAGTGKTFLAIEEAKRWARLGARVFLTCFNTNLARYLKRAIEGYGVEVDNLHGFMVRIVRAAGKEPMLPRTTPEELFRRYYPAACVEAILECNNFEPYDVLIVDEAQDLLLDTYTDVLDLIVRGGIRAGQWRMFLDPNQDLFRGIQPNSWTRILENAAQFDLVTNCRNTKNIAVTVAAVSGVQLGRTMHLAGPEIEIFFVRDPDDERRKVSKSIKRLLAEKIDPVDIVLLGHVRLENSSLAGGLIDVPYQVQEFESVEDERAIRYATVRAFKGLEADAVLMTGIDDLDNKERLLELYVGLSRARAYLELYVRESARGAFEARYREFGRMLAGFDGQRWSTAFL